jgi:histone-lysine N-methyltransferase SETD1
MNATPFTSTDSPSSIHALAKSNMSTPSIIERGLDHAMPTGQRLQQDGAPSIERIPARDPLLSTKGIKCTYDPLLDRLRKKLVNKNAKPVYKEFGLVCIITYFLCYWGGVIVLER